MTARRIMGTEVEYGISVPGDPTANPVITSTQVVLAYAAAADIPRSRRARWDYEVESPLRDARGFDLSAPTLHAPNDSELDDLGAANVILTNGARLYVDHAHPEFSTPEVTTPRDVVIWDKAGERVMEEAAMRSATVPGAPRIQLYKNNVDGKGASYGTHENYLMARTTTFPSIVAGLTPFFVTRQVICGAGRVGIGAAGDEAGYQLAQRSDYIEVEVGLETTLKRGIINTRDEPHADADKYRRLHVIIGDANMSEYSTLLKVGTAALVLDMIENNVRFDDLRLAEPVRAVHTHQPRPHPEDHRRAHRRPPVHRARHAAGVLRTGRQARREHPGRRRRRRHLRGPRPSGATCSTRWPATRWSAPTGWTGRPSCGCWRDTGSATGWRGTPGACSSSTCSTPTSAWRRASTTGSSRAAR